MIRHLLKLFILVVLSFVSVSCSRRAAQFQAEPVKKDFGPIVADTPLDLENAKPLRPAILPQDKVVTISSADWFDLANELLEGKTEASGMGQKLIENFYSLSDSHTTMSGTTNPPGSPFAEAALWFAKPMMEKAYNDSLTKAQTRVAELSRSAIVDVYFTEKYPPPELVLERMIEGLVKFRDSLNGQNGDKDSIINAVSSEIETKLAPDLEDLKKSATFNQNGSLVQNLRNLERSLTKLSELSEFDRQHLLLQVRMAISLAEQCDAIKDSDDALSFLIDVWLAKEMRKNFPASVKKVFEGLSEQEILSFVTANKAPIISNTKWEAVKGEKDSIILEDSSLVAVDLKNNGFVISPATWTDLQPRVQEFDKLLANPEIRYKVKLVANIPSDDLTEERNALVSSWLGLANRMGLPDEIRDAFSDLSEKQLELVRNNRYLVLFARLQGRAAKYRYGLMDALDKKGIDYVKQLFSDTIKSSVRERLDLALLPIARDYPDQISNAIKQALDKKRNDSEKISVDAYNNLGRYYLGKLVFQVKDLVKGDQKSESIDNGHIEKNKLPLVEKSLVNFSFQQNQWRSIESPAQTDPSVLGLSLGVLEDRVSEAPQNAVAIEYQAICKLLSIAGYHNAHNDLIESFMTSMTPSHLSQLFSVASYDPTYTVFAVPENVQLKENFKMQESSRVNPRVTVAGQMRLLYGYSKLMKFFKPWNPSFYDAGLGSIKIDEDTDIIPFHRKDYFILSTGLGAYILKNIPLRMLGLISPNHKFVDGTKVENPVQVPAIAATLSDYTLGGMEHVVSASSIAEAILGMSEFYEQIKDLQLSTDPVIQSNTQGNGLHDAQESLQRVISGLVLFATGQLRSDDGGFFHSYDLGEMVPVPGPRVLSDQLMLQKALLKAGMALQSGFMLSRASDNLFFLNSHFWSGELGFYRSSENDLGGKVSLLNVARAVDNVNLMQQPNDLTQGPKSGSITQMQRLKALWLSRFFSREIQSLPPIFQVSEFSL